MSDTDVTPEKPKAKALASGIEVWCAHERLSPIEELKPNPRNPNKHPEEQLELLAKNIRYFGWRHCITVSKRSGCIVAGHGRRRQHDPQTEHVQNAVQARDGGIALTGFQVTDEMEADAAESGQFSLIDPEFSPALANRLAEMQDGLSRLSRFH